SLQAALPDYVCRAILTQRKKLPFKEFSAYSNTITPSIAIPHWAQMNLTGHLTSTRDASLRTA
ncbi:MAG: hypothetical protein AAGU32_20850, partial [Bacillota bacterium]